jgi:hypothetical protein
MNERTKTGFEILKVAVILGVLGDILLRAMPWGLNVLLFNIAFAAGMIMLLRRRLPEYLTAQTYSLFGALVFFASMYAWRTAPELRLADTVAILAVLSVLFLPKMGVPTQIAGVFHYGVAFFWSSINSLFSPIALLISDINWKSRTRSGWSKNAIAVVRGVAIAAPILLIFGGLFVAADAAYEGWVQRVFNIRPEIVLTHILLTTFFGWLSAGYLRGILINADVPVKSGPDGETVEKETDVSPVDEMRRETSVHPSDVLNNLSILEHINISDAPDMPDEAKPPEQPAAKQKRFEWKDLENTLIPSAFTLGTVEIGVLLGLINLLFLSFVIVQVPYLFGGMDLVQNTPDFKLAAYARRGFGELVIVSALVLPILLASHWLIRRDNPFTEKLFRVFASVQIGLLFVIMASAAQRLFLLTGNLGYGLTTVRLYPMIFMSWLAIVFVWFAVTVLRCTRRHFAWGALWSAFLILGATHILNPDAFIVRTNIALMQQGRDFDANYNSSLSDDAVPVLIDSIDQIENPRRQIVIRKFVARYCEMRDETDLRSWNYDRWRAWQRLSTNQELIKEIGNCDDPLFISGSRDD